MSIGRRLFWRLRWAGLCCQSLPRQWYVGLVQLCVRHLFHLSLEPFLFACDPLPVRWALTLFPTLTALAS